MASTVSDVTELCCQVFGEPAWWFPGHSGAKWKGSFVEDISAYQSYFSVFVSFRPPARFGELSLSMERTVYNKISTSSGGSSLCYLNYMKECGYELKDIASMSIVKYWNGYGFDNLRLVLDQEPEAYVIHSLQPIEFSTPLNLPRVSGFHLTDGVNQFIVNTPEAVSVLIPFSYSLARGFIISEFSPNELCLQILHDAFKYGENLAHDESYDDIIGECETWADSKKHLHQRIIDKFLKLDDFPVHINHDLLCRIIREYCRCIPSDFGEDRGALYQWLIGTFSDTDFTV